MAGNPWRYPSDEHFMEHFDTINANLPALNRFVGRMIVTNNFRVVAQPAQANNFAEGPAMRNIMPPPVHPGPNIHGRGDQLIGHANARQNQRANNFAAGYGHGGRPLYNANALVAHNRNAPLRPHQPAAAVPNPGRLGRNVVLASLGALGPNAYDRGFEARHDVVQNVLLRNRERGEFNVRPFNVLGTLPRNTNREGIVREGVHRDIVVREANHREAAQRETANREAIQREAAHREAVHRELVNREIGQRQPLLPHFHGNALFHGIPEIDEDHEDNGDRNSPRHRVVELWAPREEVRIVNPPPVRKFRSKFTKQNDQTADAATTYAAILKHGIDGFDDIKKHFDNN